MGSPINTSHVFAGGATVKGIPASQATGQAVEHDQLIAAQATKQNNLTGGSGIELDGSAVKVDLAVTGTDYGTLTLSGSNYSSLDGAYTLASFKGSLSYAGTSLDLDVGGDYNVYYKDNGGGVWAIVAKRDTDNIHNNNSTGESTGSWLAVLVSVDPTSITEDYNNFVPNYQSVDYDMLTSSSEQDDNGNGTVSSAVSGIDYAAGNTPAGLVFENNKLAIDFASDISSGTSVNTYPASIIKTYTDEQVALAKIAGNNTFSNAVAQLAGSPANVQAMGEALKVLIDSVSSTVSNNQTLASTEYGNIDNLQAALGSATANLAATHATLSDNVTAKALINELAVLIAALRADATTSLGLSTGGFVGDIGSTVSNGSDLIAALTSIVNAVETVQGDLTARIGAVSFFHNGEEFPLTANQIAGTEALDIVKTGAGTGEENDVAAYVAALNTPRDVRILVSYGTTGDADAGIYVRDKDTGYLTRATDFDESSEIEKGDIVQVLLGGSTAFADFAVSNDSLPVVGTDAIKFELYKASGVGDKQVTEAKLGDALKAVVDNKLVPYESAVITIPANGSYSLVHGHKLYSAPMILDAAGNMQQFELDITVDGTMVITSEADSSINVTVRFAGLAL